MGQTFVTGFLDEPGNPPRAFLGTLDDDFRFVVILRYCNGRWEPLCGVRTNAKPPEQVPLPPCFSPSDEALTALDMALAEREKI